MSDPPNIGDWTTGAVTREEGQALFREAIRAAFGKSVEDVEPADFVASAVDVFSAERRPATPAEGVDAHGDRWEQMPVGSTLEWVRLEPQRAPTRAHYFLCRVHADCRAHEGVGRVCWLASGRVSGHALGLREASRMRFSLKSIVRRMRERATIDPLEQFDESIARTSVLIERGRSG